MPPLIFAIRLGAALGWGVQKHWWRVLQTNGETLEVQLPVEYSGLTDSSTELDRKLAVDYCIPVLRILDEMVNILSLS